MEEKKKNISFWSVDLLSSMDVVIIGGGIVGISTAISVSEMMPNRSVTILDKGTGHIGASVRNAGFACFGSISEILDDMDLYGLESALETIDMRWEGLQLLRKRVGDSHMDYQSVGGYELFQDEALEQKCIDFIPQINKTIEDIVGSDKCYKQCDTTIGPAIKNQLEGVLHPAKMIRKLKAIAAALGVQFCYGVNVESIDNNGRKLDTDIGTVTYQDCIVTTNAWTSKILDNHGVRPARNHVLITKPIKDCPVRGAFHMDKGYIYFRNVGDRILLGGARNIDAVHEETYDMDNENETILKNLKSILESKILKGKEFEIETRWTGLLGVSGTKEPIISKETDGLYVAVKMGGMGVAIGSYVGAEIATLFAKNS